MALKAGTVGVNPDILDNSGRVKEIPAGDHSLSFEVDEATGKAGYKIDGNDFHPFEEAGVTVYGWVKPAELSDTGLTPASDLQIVSGGIFIKGSNVYIDVVLYNAGAEAVTSDTPLITGLPGTASGNKYFVNRSIVHRTEAEADADLTMLTTPADTKAYVCYVVNDGIAINGGFPADRYLHLFGMYYK